MKIQNTLMGKLIYIVILIAIVFIYSCGKNQTISQAIGKDDLVDVKRIIKRDKSINYMDELGMTPLHYAAMFGTEEIAKYLIEQGATVGSYNRITEWTPLDYAMNFEHTDVVKLLIARGVVVDHYYKTGYPLHNAYNKEVAEILIAGGANVNENDSHKGTALHIAAEKGYQDIAELLIDRGANVNAIDLKAETALHKAAYYGHKDIVKLLIDSGTSVNENDFDSETALHEAAKQGYKDIVELLIAKGADLNASDEYGRTPIDVASQYPDIVELLRKHGASE